MSTCQHKNFKSEVKINRFEDRPELIAEIKINCSDCNEPMQFIGLPIGLSFSGASISPDGDEVRLAMLPQNVHMTPLEVIGAQLRGFEA